MKKALLISILFFYILSTTGLTFHAHYCGGRIASVSLTSDTKKKCACGIENMKKNCCKDKHQFFKVKDLYKCAADTKAPEASLCTLFCGKRLLIATVNRTIGETSCEFRIDDPPDKLPLPVYLLNRVLLI